MLKAQQQLLIQTSNQILLTIRQMEINYFLNYFSQYNTLAGLLAGFQLVSITQVVVETYATERYIKTLYWITTAGTFAPSLHCLLITSVLLVYAPNLALRGPLGSMKRAVDGMVQEQREVFYSFIATLVVFSVSVTFTFWLEAYGTEAYICTFFMVLGAFMQWRFCLRIYNRFKFYENFSERWDKPESERKIRDSDELPAGPVFDMDDRGSSISVSHRWSERYSASARGEDGASAGVGRSEGYGSEAWERGSQHTLRIGENSSNRPAPVLIDEQQQKKKKSVLRRLFHLSGKGQSQTASQEIAAVDSTSVTGNSTVGTVVTSSTSAAPARLFKTGYGSIKNSSTGKWDRQFLVLTGRRLWLYKDRDSYNNDPEHPAKLRPIAVEEYSVAEQPVTLIASSSLPSVGSTKQSPPQKQQQQKQHRSFVIVLQSLIHQSGNAPESSSSSSAASAMVVKSWHIRLDTAEELAAWMQTLRTASVLPSSDALVAGMDSAVYTCGPPALA